MTPASNSAWTVGVPIAACGILAAFWAAPSPAPWSVALIGATLVAAVFAAVHHAEVIAIKVGEPFGTLVLAMAVTVIELGLIGSIMLSSGTEASTLARDTVFATVMIVCNGVVGFCLVVGGLRHHVLVFRVEGAVHALAVLTPLTVLTLVVPAFTTTTPGPMYSPAQVVFAGVCSFALYCLFVFVQTVRHREYFVPAVQAGADVAPPSTRMTWTSVVLLLAALAAVVGLAKKLAPSIESGVAAISAPPAVVGVVIAVLVLLPETVAAIRAAARNQMQTSLNLALGSALATIGLTIPAVGALSMITGVPLALGLPPKEMSLLVMTLFVSAISLATGSATVLYGGVHVAIFIAFLFLSIVP